MYASHIGTGALGEQIAERFLAQKGFLCVTRNYRKPWGEIDLIMERRGIYHFVEVKTRTERGQNVLRPAQTGENISGDAPDEYRAEENIHEKKLKRLHRAIETYILENNLENEWQLDVVTVSIDRTTKRAHCKLIENVL